MNCGKKQTDLIIMDFAKGIRQGTTQEAITQIGLYWDKRIRPQVDQLMALRAHSTSSISWSGLRSSPSVIWSPQGSVLGPILFLIFIDDLPDNTRSSVCLFPDDCVLYRNIYSIQEFLILQKDFTSLEQRGADWQMKFNVAQCHPMRVTRHPHHKHPSQKTLENIQSAKYLGITIFEIWIGINTFQKFLPKQLRHSVSFEGIWLLRLGVLRKLHTKLCFSLN